MAVSVKALFFDVFGTLVDWRTSIAREAEAMLKPLGFYARLARLRRRLGAANTRAPWTRCAPAAYRSAKLDILHRRNLELILPRFHVGTLTEAQRHDLNLAWHRLDAWPDVPPGLARLKRKYMLAPVSNGNISLMVDLARRNSLPWDAILGSEIAGDYKPKPRVYLAAAEALDLPPHECMMVAAHTKDLMAAAALACAPATSRAPTSTAPAGARRRRARKSISRRRVWRIWPGSWGRNFSPPPCGEGQGWGSRGFCKR